MSSVLGIAGAVAMIAGAIMARKNHAQAVKVLWASVAVCVAAMVLDTSGTVVEMFDEVIKGEEIFGGLACWGAISAGVARVAVDSLVASEGCYWEEVRRNESEVFVRKRTAQVFEVRKGLLPFMRRVFMP